MQAVATCLSALTTVIQEGKLGLHCHVSCMRTSYHLTL